MGRKIQRQARLGAVRILLVSYYFPPFNSVGAVRPGKLARFLKRQGHEVSILTCSNQPFLVGLPLEVAADSVVAVPAWSINAPVEWLRGGRSKVAEQGFGNGGSPGSAFGLLGRVYKTLFHWPDAQLGWVRNALGGGRKLLGAARYDLIYASAPPFSGLRVAAALSKEFGVPWIAELRDLWTDNHAYVFPAWRRAIERRWEAGVLAGASALVTVSPPLVGKLQRFGIPVWEVRNGCDPEDFDDLIRPESFEQASDILNVVFTGNVYDGRYDVAAFCEGLAYYMRQGGKAKVHVAGRNTGALREAAKVHGVEEHFSFRSSVPRATALAMQRSADVLLTFLWDGGTDEGIYSAKLFEYAGAGKPILAVGDSMSDVGALIESADLGRAHADPEMMGTQLLSWQQDKQLQGNLSVKPMPGYDFTRRSQFTALEKRMVVLLVGRSR